MPSSRFKPVDPIGEIKYVLQNLREDDQLFIGIDPGLSGAIAFLPTRKKLDPFVLDIPTLTAKVKSSKKGKATTSNRSSYDWPAIVRIFDPVIDHSSKVVIALERGQPYPNDTAKTAFSIGMSTYMWHLYFTAFGLSLEELRPADWKRKMKLLHAEKDASRMLAMRLFPGANHYFACKSDHDRAEAILIATCCYRLHSGKL